jgi:hypothetical protein
MSALFLKLVWEYGVVAPFYGLHNVVCRWVIEAH